MTRVACVSAGLTMRLDTLVEQANKSLSLGMNSESVNDVVARMRLAGYTSDVPQTQVSSAYDMVVALTRNSTRVGASYSEVKAETTMQWDVCAICQGKMADVELVGGRKAKYCQTDHVTMPVKAEA